MGTAVLRTLASGSGIALTYGGTDSEIVISSAGGSTVDALANVGAGSGIWRDTLAGVASLRSLVAGTGLSIATGTNEITISSAGGSTVDVVANVGAGAGLWRDTLAGVASLRSLVAGTGISIAVGTNQITVGLTTTPSNPLIALSWAAELSLSNNQFLRAGSNIGASPVAGVADPATCSIRLPFEATLKYVSYTTKNANFNTVFCLNYGNNPSTLATMIGANFGEIWGFPAGAGAVNAGLVPYPLMPANTPIYCQCLAPMGTAPDVSLFTFYFSY